jgi:hypothetical protein
MMNIPRAVLVTLIGICFKAGLLAQEEAVVLSPSFVEFDLLVVQVPEPSAIPLIPQLRDGKQCAKAVERILSLVGTNKAKLVAWPVLATKSGQRAVVEQIEEFRYATEYQQAGTSRLIETEPKTPGMPGAPGPTQTSPKSSRPEKVVTIQSEFDAVPEGFQTRNLGVTLEIEPVVGPDGKTIDLSFSVHHSWLDEMRRIEAEAKVSRRIVVIDQPNFLSNRVTTSISVKDGDYSLIGNFRTKKPEGYIEFFILHTQLKRVY